MQQSILLSQDKIDNPAATRVFVALPAVIQDVGVAAAGVFQRVGEDGQGSKARSW
jgi:hypothetical protein